MHTDANAPVSPGFSEFWHQGPRRPERDTALRRPRQFSKTAPGLSFPTRTDQARAHRSPTDCVAPCPGQPEVSLCAPEPTKTITRASPKSAFPAFPSRGSHGPGCRHVFLAPSAPRPALGSSSWPSVAHLAPPFQTCKEQTVLSVATANLLVLPRLNYNKTYILKHPCCQ